ncbi:MAG: hypothetical protein HOV80_35385 [Polyangiaceae bacterium]|nr:hypothetical protein [Polyangiaceae bacterium]
MRVSSFRLAAALVALACACGDDDDGGPGGAGGSDPSGPTTASTTGPSTTADTTTTSATTGNGGAAGGSALGGGGAGGEDPWGGPLVHLAELDLGALEMGDLVAFPIPDRTLGLTTFSAISGQGIVGIALLRPPNSSAVVNDYEVPGTGLPAFINNSAVAAADPQSDLPQAWPVLEGDWRIRLVSDGAMTADTSVFVRRTMDGAFHGGVVDINVLIAPASGVDSGYMNPVLDAVFANYWGPGLGLSKGNVTFTSLSSSYDVISSADELAQMFTTSAGIGAAPALNLFVVADFDYASALGIAGGIPGSPMVHGTPRSGVAYTPSGNQGYDASVVAHEMGHLAGLFHTTEMEITAFDPLGDTLTCPNINSMNPANCPDVGNVMFPIAYGGGTFSPLQARVVQGSAIYRGIIEDGGLPGAPLPSLLPINLLPPPAPVAYNLPLDTGRVPATPLERALDAPACDRIADADASLLAALAPTAGELEAVARDESLSDRARARALQLLWRSSPEPATDIAALLFATGAGRRIDMAAVTILDAEAPSLLAELSDLRAPIADPAVMARLDRLGFSSR